MIRRISFNPNWTPLVLINCCALWKLPDFFSDHSNLLLKNVFFPFFNCLEEIDRKTPRSFLYPKWKKKNFFHFFRRYFKIEQQVFWGLFEVLHIPVGQKKEIIIWLFQLINMITSKIVKFWATEKLNISKQS